MTDTVAYRQRIKLPYRYTTGEVNETFLEGLAAGKILGSKCEACGLTMVPAKPFCSGCSATSGEPVEVASTGTLVTHSRRHDGAVIGLIRLDDTDTHFPHVVDAEQVETGMRLKARFAADPEPEITAIEAFEPV